MTRNLTEVRYNISFKRSKAIQQREAKATLIWQEVLKKSLAQQATRSHRVTHSENPCVTNAKM
ncbi:hypothetical protein J6590_049546 [Homalodisca vitripennis]|nr:hypothetical protein J6590_049546 [Homalodisca vitripennis]